MYSPKQMMDFKPMKSVAANVSNEHQRNWSNEHFERKAKNPDHNYDRSRTDLNFQVGPGGVITAVDKSRRIGDKVEEIIQKHLRPDARVTAISNRAVMAVFGGNRERMREMAFGSQVLNEYEETNSHLVRQPEIERWAKDVYGFVCREFGEENVASFIVHLDETGPHAHCVFVPLTADGRLCSKEVLGGKNKIEARQHMRDLHTRLVEVNRKYGLDRGDDIHETGARHRSTAEYNRDLHRENAKLETLISDKSGQLSQLEDQIKKAETRVKGLTTMIANLERQELELNDEIAQLKSDIENGAGDVSELRCRIASLEAQLESTGQKLADKRDKLKLADRLLAEQEEERRNYDEIKAGAKAKALSFFGRGELAEAKKSLKSKDEEIAKLRSQLAEAEKKMAKMRRAIGSERDGYKREIEATVKRAERAEAACAAKDKRIEQLDRQLHPERYRLSSGAELLHWWIPNRLNPTLSIWTNLVISQKSTL